MKQSQRLTNVFLFPDYHIWSSFRHDLIIFGPGAKFCCNLTAMTSRCSPLVLVSVGQNMRNPIFEIPRDTKIMQIRTGWFRHVLQTCTICPGKFDEDSIWLLDFDKEGWMTNTGGVRSTRLWTKIGWLIFEQSVDYPKSYTQSIFF